MTSARQRHNESRAATSSWIRRNVKERERQARVAEAAVEEGAEIFQHFRRRNQQRTRANGEQKSERTGGGGTEEERWGPKAQELMKRTSSRGESAAARDVASFRASQQKTSASSHVSYGQ